MECVILCAGYATRLYPLTLDKPKALLPINGTPLLSHIIKKIPESIENITIVSNEKFFPHFCSWAETHPRKTYILNDRTSSNESRLGGIGDLFFAIENKPINDNLLVILGDNFFDFDLENFINFFNSVNCTTLGVCSLKDQDLRNLGVVEVSEGKIISFEEKPINPKSELAAIGIYAFTRNDLLFIREYMKTELPKDGPGFLIKYFLSRKSVHSFIFKGNWFDIGSKEIYSRINNELNDTWN